MTDQVGGTGLIGVPVHEDAYAADVRVIDRYQGYGAELLRLSLLALAGYGFLMKEALGNVAIKNQLAQLKIPLIAGAVLFGLAALCALMHRGLSSEALAYMITVLRVQNRDSDRAKREEKCLRRYLKSSGVSLVLAALFLGLGALFFVFAFAWMLQ